MFVEIHLLQNFAPSNLNRDDTNSPKECTFGGSRRARISSQCLKRAIRTHSGFIEDLRDRTGTRTKLVHERLVEHLVEKGREEEAARGKVLTCLEGMGFKWDEEKARTAVLLFVSDAELRCWAEVVDEHFDAIPTRSDGSGPDEGAEPEPKTARAKKRAKADKLDAAVRKALEAAMRLSRTDAVDIALFGRMVAENTNMNVDAACQVAHAVSTHAVDLEMDFYTAVDDLQPKEDTGAGMMGVVEFNSACFYRYALIDTQQLAANLGGDGPVVRDAVLAFCKAAVAAIPTGKQKGFAAQNPPDWIRLEVRGGAPPRSLVNAFVDPVRAREGDLVRSSVERAEQYGAALATMLGEDSAASVVGTSSTLGRDEDVSLPDLWERLATSLDGGRNA